jgi:hypothetical protein
MPATATTNQVQRIRDLLLQLEWTESDAWILVSELADSFRATLDQHTPTLNSMPESESAVLIQSLEELLTEEERRVADPLATARTADPVPPAE